MKKIICLLLCLAMALAVCGCGNDTNETTGSTTEAPADETTVPPATEPSVQQNTTLQLPMIAVCMPLTVQKASADDGVTVFTTTFQDVALTLTDPEYADGAGGLKHIPFKETRNYVKKVGKARDVYERLYGEEYEKETVSP